MSECRDAHTPDILRVIETQGFDTLRINCNGDIFFWIFILKEKIEFYADGVAVGFKWDVEGECVCGVGVGDEIAIEIGGDDGVVAESCAAES